MKLRSAASASSNSVPAKHDPCSMVASIEREDTSRRASVRRNSPIVSRTNAIKILNREGLLRTGDNTEADENLSYTTLPPGEPSLGDDKTAYQLLPKARACSEGEAGMW